MIDSLNKLELYHGQIGGLDTEFSTNLDRVHLIHNQNCSLIFSVLNCSSLPSKICPK